MRDGRYEKKVKDYNFGSLIRTDARQEYSETNTIFVTRIQVRSPLPPLRARSSLALDGRRAWRCQR